jgi:hypothetical protein
MEDDSDSDEFEQAITAVKEEMEMIWWTIKDKLKRTLKMTGQPI